MQSRTLTDGQRVFVHQNNGLRKRCGCPRRGWAKCPHPWHFSFKWRGVHHRFQLDKYAADPITDKDKARTEADRLRAAIRAGTFPPPTPSAPATPADITFAESGRLWLERGRADVSETQRANDRSKLAVLSALSVGDESLGDRRLGRVTLDDLEVAFLQLSARAGSTQNKYRQVVLHLQAWLVEHGYLPRPWIVGKKAIKRQKGAKRDRRLVPDTVDDEGRVVEPGEERRLLSVASAWFCNLIIAALETCCRRGELLTLQWRDVLPAVIRIRAEKAKTGEARDIPISSRLRAVLDMVRLDPAGRPHGSDAYVFGDRIGRKVADPKKQWEGVVLRAFGHTPTWTHGKLSAESRAQYRACDLRFHDLRHEGASRWLEAGWPLQHVQRLLGHADAKTTSIYLNVTTQQLLDTMKRFPGPERPALHKVAHPAPVTHGLVGNGELLTAGKSLVN